MKATIIRQEKDEKFFTRTELVTVYGNIISGKYANEVNKVREEFPLTFLHNGPKFNELDSVKKARRICFAAKWKKTDGQSIIDNFNGLILLEINRLSDEEEAKKVRNESAKIPYTLMSFVGINGCSVKIVCRASLPDGQLPDNNREKFLKEAYRKLHYIYSTQLQMSIDKIPSTLESSCYVSVDPEAVFREDAITLAVTDNETPSLKPLVMPKKAEELPIFDKRTKSQTDRLLYHYCFIDALNKTRLEDDEARVSILLNLLAQYCHESGLPIAMCIKLTKYNPEFGSDELLVDNIFMEAYHKDIENFYPEKHLSKVQLMAFKQEAFMNTFYEFRKNIISGKNEFRYKDSYEYSFRPMEKEDRYTMTLKALKMGLESWDKDLDRYLDSTLIPTYDPINNYLDNLPKWDGKDRVEEFAKRVPTNNADFAHNFHVWMLSMVAHWMGRTPKQANAIVPLFIGKQGCGKSSFCSIILPPELQEFYNDRIDFKNDTSMFMGLTNTALINIDEFDSVSSGKQPLLKYLISTPAVRMRMPYQASISNRRRYASFVATTNNVKPLKDLTGSRRYLCINVNGNINFTTVVEYNQLYAQLVAEIAAGKRYFFNDEENMKIMNDNKPFVEISEIEPIIDSLFRNPLPNETPQELSLPEVVDIIRQYYKLIGYDRKTLVNLGRLLSNRGFEGKKTNKCMKYKMILTV
ncbi:MAG: hypothetical protein KA235_08235 [Prevotella sp.]|nr:hypothetical protein [Prevotella sp.]